MADTTLKIRWLEEPEAGDYPAALSYLSLLYEASHAKALVKQLGKEQTIEFKAKDIFRASGLSLLGVSNSHVQRDLDKVRNGKRLSPLLLVRAPGIAMSGIISSTKIGIETKNASGIRRRPADQRALVARCVAMKNIAETHSVSA